MRPMGFVRLPLVLGVALLLLLIGSVVAFGQGAAGAGGTITLSTRPEAHEIVPDEVEAPTRFIVEARGPQGPLRNAYIDVEMTAPTSGALASTDIPAIESTTLMKSRFGAPDGRLEFDYVVPIRGTYKVKVQAIPAPGATFQPIAKEFDLMVSERQSEVVNFYALIAGLFVVGLAAGAVLGYANRGSRAAV